MVRHTSYAQQDVYSKMYTAHMLMYTARVHDLLFLLAMYAYCVTLRSIAFAFAPTFPCNHLRARVIMPFCCYTGEHTIEAMATSPPSMLIPLLLRYAIIISCKSRIRQFDTSFVGLGQSERGPGRISRATHRETQKHQTRRNTIKQTSKGIILGKAESHLPEGQPERYTR